MDLAARQAAAARGAAQRALAENQPPPPPAAYQPPPRPIAYQPVDYVTPSNHRRHRIVALKNYTDPVTRQTCNTYSEFTFSDAGRPQVSGSGRACKGADGVWHG
jgi:surface antigen